MIMRGAKTRLLTRGAPWLVLGGCFGCGGISTADGGFDGGAGGSTAGAGGPFGEDSGSGGEAEMDPELIDCSGVFDEPRVAFVDPGWMPQALSPTPDGLEFFYLSLADDLSIDVSGKRRPFVRRRSSVEEPWSEPEELTELTDVCELWSPGTEPAALDVSLDSRRLYLGCNAMSDSDRPTGPLLVASRVDRQSPFVVQDQVFGEVGISLGITRDELSAYGTTITPDFSDVLLYQRSSLAEPFGAPATLGISMRNPEPSPDGLALYGVKVPGSVLYSELVVATRTEVDAPWGEPLPAELPAPPSGYSDHSPALSGDCRSLYFMRRRSQGPFEAQVLVMGR